MTQADLSKMTQAELIAMVQGLQAKAEQPIRCKVSEKGAVAIYGLGRWPVTLYKSQFDRLDAAWDMVREFRKANDALLSAKPETTKGE